MISKAILSAVACVREVKAEGHSHDNKIKHVSPKVGRTRVLDDTSGCDYEPPSFVLTFVKVVEAFVPTA
jgi:hypothetical protein